MGGRYVEIGKEVGKKKGKKSGREGGRQCINVLTGDLSAVPPISCTHVPRTKEEMNREDTEDWLFNFTDGPKLLSVSFLTTPDLV